MSHLQYLKPRIAMMLLALEYVGLTEVKGEQDNPQILTFFQDIGFNWVQHDELSWCSAFINWIALKCKCERSFKLDARSWLKKGRVVDHPLLGHVVIFWREDPTSWKGHISLYVGEDETHVHCLGGNQSDQVRVSRYPKERVLGYRELEYI